MRRGRAGDNPVSAGPSTVSPVILRTTIRPHGDTTAEPQPLEAVAESFDQGMADLRALAPGGWDMLGVIVDREQA